MKYIKQIVVFVLGVLVLIPGASISVLAASKQSEVAIDVANSSELMGMSMSELVLVIVLATFIVLFTIGSIITMILVLRKKKKLDQGGIESEKAEK